jgi:hypothetical protein
MHSLWIVQEHAVRRMRHETNPERHQWFRADGAAGYAEAAGAFRAFRGGSALSPRGRVRGPDAAIVDATAMLADPWVAHVLSRDAADS